VGKGALVGVAVGSALESDKGWSLAGCGVDGVDGGRTLVSTSCAAVEQWSFHTGETVGRMQGKF
jgi:hypothetical protein